MTKKKEEKEQENMSWSFIYKYYSYLLFRSNDSTLLCTFTLLFFSSLLLVLLNQSTNTHTHKYIHILRNEYKHFNETSTKTLYYMVDYQCRGQIISLNEGCLILSVKQLCLTSILKLFV
jgi:hypothetical protein